MVLMYPFFLAVGPDAGEQRPQARFQGTEKATERSLQEDDQPEAERATHTDHSARAEAPVKVDLRVLSGEWS